MTNIDNVRIGTIVFILDSKFEGEVIGIDYISKTIKIVEKITLLDRIKYCLPKTNLYMSFEQFNEEKIFIEKI